MLHIQSSRKLHWVGRYTPCDMIRMDFRDRIRQVLEERGVSARDISLQAGSDSMLNKLLNPEKRGGIKFPTIARIEAVAHALEVSPAWLAFGEGRRLTESELREMVQIAVEDIQIGMSIEEIREVVASTLHEQLETALAELPEQDSSDAGSARGRDAGSSSATSGDA